MKLLTIAFISASLALAPAAHAGNLIFEAPVDQEVDEAAPIGGSGQDWIVPVLALALIAAVVIASDDDDDEPAAELPQERLLPTEGNTINLR